MAIDKLERQLGLLATLLHTEHPLRAVEIQRQVEGYPEEQGAFRRSFERDKDDLRRLGIPLAIQKTETVDGPVDGYYVSQSDYYLHDLGLEADEVIALAVALRLIRLEGVVIDDAMWKLGGTAPPADMQGAELAAISMGPAVTQLHEAISSKSAVSFTYRDAERTVEPWRLAFKRGQWYLNGYDRGRGDSRSFRLDRIDGALSFAEPGTAVQPRMAPSNDRQPWQFSTDDDQVYQARVAVDASHARWVRHHLAEAEVVAEHDDGAIEIQLEVTNVGAFRSLMLSMLDNAEVLEPAELRRDMVSWLEKLAAT